jgi:hypothetical protein
MLERPRWDHDVVNVLEIHSGRRNEVCHRLDRYSRFDAFQVEPQRYQKAGLFSDVDSLSHMDIMPHYTRHNVFI